MHVGESLHVHVLVAAIMFYKLSIRQNQSLEIILLDDNLNLFATISCTNIHPNESVMF